LTKNKAGNYKSTAITENVLIKKRSERTTVVNIIENITLKILLKEASKSIASLSVARKSLRKSPRRSKNSLLLVLKILTSLGGGVPNASFSELRLKSMAINAPAVMRPASLSG
jgi:hypothetical protein